MVIENELNDVLDTECLSSTTIKMADAYSTTEHLVNTAGTETLTNESLQPKRNCKRKAVVNNATDYKVTKIHTGITKKKVVNRHTPKKVPHQKKVKVATTKPNTCV